MAGNVHTSFKIDLFAHDRDLILSKSRYSTTSASLVHSSRALAIAMNTGSREAFDFFDLAFFLSFESVMVVLEITAACADAAAADDDEDEDEDDDDADDDVFLLVNIMDDNLLRININKYIFH